MPDYKAGYPVGPDYQVEYPLLPDYQAGYPVSGRKTRSGLTLVYIPFRLPEYERTQTLKLANNFTRGNLGAAFAKLSWPLCAKSSFKDRLVEKSYEQTFQYICTSLNAC